jgi:shikimate dehydrogenase
MYSNNLTLGLLGEHIENSFSPLIHKNFIRYYSLNYSYLLFQLKSNNLKRAIIGLKALGIRGVNITLPFKEKAMEWMDSVDPAAKNIGAINTILNKNEKLYGYNTDWNGFIIPLRGEMKIISSRKKAVILGAGGASRAVIFALADEKYSVISIFNRNKERASEIKNQYKSIFPDSEIRIFSFQVENLQKEINQADLLVNTTPLGSWYYPDQNPLPGEIMIPSRMIVYDLIYHPEKTPLLALADMYGCRILNGMPMLVYQAAESFYLWTGIYPDQEIIDQTLRQVTQKMNL